MKAGFCSEMPLTYDNIWQPLTPSKKKKENHTQDELSLRAARLSTHTPISHFDTALTSDGNKTPHNLVPFNHSWFPSLFKGLTRCHQTHYQNKPTQASSLSCRAATGRPTLTSGVALYHERHPHGHGAHGPACEVHAAAGVPTVGARIVLVAGPHVVSPGEATHTVDEVCHHRAGEQAQWLRHRAHAVPLVLHRVQSAGPNSAASQQIRHEARPGPATRTFSPQTTKQHGSHPLKSTAIYLE